MILKCFDGPMDGAVYALADRGNTTRKPDGLWFDGTDEHGRNVQHQYAGGNAMPLVDCKEPVCLEYRYTGPVVETGIDFETCDEEPSPKLKAKAKQNALDALEKAQRRDWRVGLKVTPKVSTHQFYGQEGTIEAVHGDMIHVRLWDPEPAVYEEPADEWITA